MKPLSPITYVKRNFKRVAMTGISILIGAFIVYFFSLITETTNYSLEIGGLNVVDKYSVVFPGNSNGIPKDVFEDFKRNKNLDHIIPQKINVGSVRYQLGLGSMMVDVYNLYSEDVPKFLDTLGLKMIEGQLPKEGSTEVLIHSRFAKQNNLKIDSIISNHMTSVKVQGELKVVGIFDGPSVLVVASTDSNKVSREDAFAYGFLYSSKDGSHKDLSYFSSRKDLNLQIYDYTKVSKQMKDTTGALNVFSYGLGIFIIVVLCMTLGNLNYITFSNRIQEFFILHAIGYKNGTLMKKLWKENLIVCIVGYILGITLCLSVVSGLNLCIFNPKGKPFLLFSLEGLMLSLTVPIFVSFFSLIPCLTSKYHEKINAGI